MSFKILAINPGSTSTKIALFEDDKVVMSETLRHTTEEITAFPTIIAQLDWRKKLVTDALAKGGYAINSLSAVIGRGGLVKPIESGVYEVNEALQSDLRTTKLHHASNLGGLIAAEIAQQAGVKAYIADPVVVDEMDEIARISGLPKCPRTSVFHALNQKAIARLYAKERGKRYEDLNLIIAHLGGGITVSAHCKGRVIDTTNALGGDGPISPERAGTVPPNELVKLCYSGKYTESEMQKMLAGRGGVMAHLGTASMYDVGNMVREGDPKATLILNAVCYTVAKEIGAMATVLEGKMEAIILTGGIAHNELVVKGIEARCAFLAPIAVYPGENEMEALADNALRVLRGEAVPKIYA